MIHELGKSTAIQFAAPEALHHPSENYNRSPAFSTVRQAEHLVRALVETMRLATFGSEICDG